MIIIGIDPSSIKVENKSSYGAATVWEGNKVIEEIRFNQSPKDVFKAFLKYKSNNPIIGLEKVWGMPWDTPKTAFSLGGGFALLTFFSTYISNRVELIPPKKWQKYYDLSRQKGESKKDYKRSISNFAKARYPNEHIIQNTADSYLIGEYTLNIYGKT